MLNDLGFLKSAVCLHCPDLARGLRHLMQPAIYRTTGSGVCATDTGVLR